MKMLRLSAFLLMASVSSAFAQLVKDSYSEAECDYMVEISDGAIFPTICKYPHLQPVMAEITRMRYGLEGDFYNIEIFSKFLTEVEQCDLNQQCAEPAFFDYHAYLVEETEEQNAAIATILAERRANCPEKTYKELRASCFILFSAEYGCNQALSGEWEDVGGRSTASAAICSIAAQTVFEGELQIEGLAFALGSGVADDIAESYFEERTVSDAFSGALFKLGSLAILGLGVQSCVRKVDYECGR